MKIWIKNVLLGWLSLLATSLAIGQSINQAEYFINKDPGVGNGTEVSITTGSTLDESFTFSTEGLEVGNHTLYVRTKEAGGFWSLDKAIPFYVQDTVKDVAFSEQRLIVAAEYFIDKDPKVGNGINIPVATSEEVEENFTVITDGLKVGEHKLYVRTQDDSGIWSLADPMDLYIQDTVKFVSKVENRFIVAAEYYIDSVRAVGKGSVIPVTVSGEVSSEFSIQTAGLSNGAHKLYVRTQGNDGLWSLQKSLGFAVLPTEANLPLPLFRADTVAKGELTTFTNLSDSIDENSTYKWDLFDDKTVEFTSKDITFSFDTTGLFPVRLTVFNGSDSSSYLGRVLVGNFTNREISASGSTSLCDGEEVTFTVPDDYLHYSWNTGDSTQSITVSKAGNYFAWLTDDNGYTIKSKTVGVNVSLSFLANVNIQNATTGKSNGFAEVISENETLSYSWSTGATEKSYINGLASGNYSIDISSGQCIETINFTITEEAPAATDVVAAEYFFDTDPGVGLGNALNIGSGQEVNFAIGISTTGLSLGNHRLYVRTMDNEGLWSLSNQMEIFIKDTDADTPVVENRMIAAAEYFFDADPGVGNGTSIDVPTIVSNISEDLNIETSSLTSGEHLLYVRTLSDDGLWSQTVSMKFQNCTEAVDLPLVENVVVCPDENLVLTAVGATDHTYQWYDADSVIVENQTTDTYSIGQVDKDMVFYVSQKDVNGCQSELAKIEISAPQIDVFAGIDASISEAGPDYELTSFYPLKGIWSGTGITETGIIERGNINSGDISYVYTVDSLNCSFSDSKVMSVLNLSEHYDVTLAENQISGTLIEQIINDDIESYETISGEVTAVSVDDSGRVVIADSSYFDFEVNPSPKWGFFAFQNLEFTYSVSLDVSLSDAPDAPVILDQELTVAENSAIGTNIGSISATDQDSPKLTFSIENGNEDGIFSLQNENELTIANPDLLDYETNQSFVLVMSVSDGDLSNTANVTVNVSDVNESPMITVQTFSLDENSANGTSIGSVVASDPEGDALTYSITAGNTNTAFAIDESLGELTVANGSKLDFELTPIFSLTVQVDDGSLNVSSTITINLNDISENATPEILDQSFSINENSSNGTVVGTVVASDPDGDDLTYSITSGNTNTAFSIDGSTGAITVANVSELDFEATPTFSLTVQVADSELSASAGITIDLKDVDESVNQSPQILEQSFSISENSSNGTSVGTVVASDPDGDDLSYSITSGNTNTAFSIDGTTGAITVANVSELDFETTPTFPLTVQVADSELSASAIITVDLKDVDESVNQAPQIVAQAFNIDENSSNGTIVGTVIGFDPDGDVISFQIINGNDDGGFVIDESTGILTISNPSLMDFEVNPRFDLVVEVSDGQLQGSETVTINLNDLDESENQSPQISIQTFSIDENSSNGTSVGTVVATDPDNDALTYTITGGNTNNAFAIDASSGLLIVANESELDFEVTPSFSLTVQVADDALNASATITVDLNDVNENTTPSISDQTFTVIENSDAGTIVGTVQASDADGDALNYSITGGNTDNAFAIGNANGEIVVGSSSALVFANNPTFSITVLVNDGQADASAIITITVEESMLTSFNELNSKDLTIFPNPAGNFIELENLEAINVEKIVCVDMNGKNWNAIYKNGNVLDISDLRAGLYQLLIYQKNGKLLQGKFMKE